MNYRLRILLSLAILLAVLVPTSGQVGHVVEVRMPVSPSPVPAEGKIHLVYELHITNLSWYDATLTRVVAIEAEGDARLMVLEGEELARHLRIVGVRGAPPINDGISLPAGDRAILYMWLSLEPGTVPDAITHRISLNRMSSDGDIIRHEFDTEPLGLGPPPIVISPPFLDGEWWVSSWDGRQKNDTGHRRAGLISVNGYAPIAQRFARDWFCGKEPRGKKVVAVADGVVCKIKDGIPEKERGSQRSPVPITLETILGNYVILDIGNERYAVYGHLQPDLLVREGDRVRTGDALGLVGASGNAMGNHLHFQIVDRPSPAGGEGMPYVFERLEIIGVRLGRGKEGWRSREHQIRKNEMPMEGAILRFHAK